MLAFAQTAPAASTERYDHNGSVGLLLAGGGGNRDQELSTQVQSGWSAIWLAGGTLSIGHSGNEIVLESFGMPRPTLDLGLAAGYRSYFGPDQLKTFLA